MQASAFDGATRNFQQKPGVLKQRIGSLEQKSGRQSDAAFLLPLRYSVELLRQRKTHVWIFFQVTKHGMEAENKYF